MIPLFCFLAVVLLAMPARKLAKTIGLIDRPDERKTHEKAVPPIGGLVIFPVFMMLGVLGGLVDLKIYWPLYTGLIVLLVTGALDDRFSLKARTKFIVHFSVAALVVFWGNCQVAYLGDLFGFGVVWAGFMAYPFSIIAVVLLINAVNLMDGLDGLAGGMSVVMFGWMAFAAALAGAKAEVLVLLSLIAAIAGFLVFNMRSPWRRRASMFLGDSGSMCLGLVIGWFAIKLAQGPHMPLEPMAVAWVIGLPIFDACAQFFRRVRNGKHPFDPDRGHFHHHLVDAGFDVKIATPLIMVIVAIMGAVGVLGQVAGLPVVVLTLLWIKLLFAHMALCYKPHICVSLLSRLRG